MAKAIQSQIIALLIGQACAKIGAAPGIFWLTKHDLIKELCTRLDRPDGVQLVGKAQFGGVFAFTRIAVEGFGIQREGQSVGDIDAGVDADQGLISSDIFCERGKAAFFAFGVKADKARARQAEIGEFKPRIQAVGQRAGCVNDAILINRQTTIG